jgi:peptide deformylase
MEKKNACQIIPKHEVISRLVKPEDLERVYKDAEEMYKLLFQRHGLYNLFYAIAHPQITQDDPLRFFVVNNKLEEFKDWRSIVIINPVIIKHSNYTVENEEGCMTFSKSPMTKVNRWQKIQVEFSDLNFKKREDGKFQPVIGARRCLDLTGKIAKVFQHEQDHLDAKYIY